MKRAIFPVRPARFACAAGSCLRGWTAAVLLGILGIVGDGMCGPVVIERAPGNVLKAAGNMDGIAKDTCSPEILMDGCRQEGKTDVRPSAGNGMQADSRWVGPAGQKCQITETFTPTKDSIRWDVAVACDDAKPWTAPLVFRLKYPATVATRFWTSWLEGAFGGGPQPGNPAAIIMNKFTWGDPLVVAPLTMRRWELGQNNKSAGAICIPIATLLEHRTDSGVSLVVSPDQPLLHLFLGTEADGTVWFRHEWLRLGERRTVKLTGDVVAHEADWRGGLRWMVSRYPEYFNPTNPKADELAGTSSYSHHRGMLDDKQADRLRKMAYRFNWAATFDWPYFGMYLPPVPNADATWETSGHDATGKRDLGRVLRMSCRMMNDECRHLKERGFYQLSYFNLTEFGSHIGRPDTVKANLPDAECWQDATTMLYRKFPGGILRDVGGDAPTFSWSDSVAMDPGDPAFRAHLLEMAQRHIDYLPDAAGICIDRMDWLVHVNYGADDGTGWYPGDLPGRSLLISWNNIMPELGKLMHSNGKVVFGNPSVFAHQLNLMRELDGFYDEFGYEGFSLNGSCLLALRKPAIMWTPSADTIQPDPDRYFQRHLYMGAYPTAPFPENDHTIQPGTANDQLYLDYGPLLDAMRGKKWVLQPHCIEVAEGPAKANLFNVPGGWVAPVVFAPSDGMVGIVIRNVLGMPENPRVDALLPGVEQPHAIQATFHEGCLQLQVPVHRGCAMVRIRRPD